MADSIGTFVFVYLQGEIGVSKPRNKDISREGVQGSAWRIYPAKGQTFVLLGMSIFASNAAAAAAPGAYANIINSTQTIVIGNLGTFTNYFIEDVNVPEIPKLVFTSVGLEWMVMSNWKVRAL